MSEIDIVQVTGFVGGLLWSVGFWMIATEVRHAFLISLLGEMTMAAAGFMLGVHFLTFWCVVWVIQDLIAWRGSTLEDD